MRAICAELDGERRISVTLTSSGQRPICQPGVASSLLRTTTEVLLLEGMQKQILLTG